MRSLIVGIFLVLFFAKCSDKQSPILKFSHDAEKDTTWINEEFLRESPFAHSGKQVSYTDANINYSLGLKKRIGAISDKKLRKIIFSAWVYLDSLSAFPRLEVVSSIDYNGKNISWTAFPLKDQVLESHKWTFVRAEFKFPYQSPPDPSHMYSVYILNTSKTTVLIDDVNCEFETE